MSVLFGISFQDFQGPEKNEETKFIYVLLHNRFLTINSQKLCLKVEENIEKLMKLVDLLINMNGRD